MADAMATDSSGRGSSDGSSKSEYLTGIALLLVVVLLWTASNFLTNTVLTHGYDKPFAVTFANTSSFALYLIPFLCVPGARRRARRRGSQEAVAEAQAEADDAVSSPGASAWYIKLGFVLPERSASSTSTASTSHNDVEERAGLLANAAPTHLAPTPSTRERVSQQGVDLAASVDSLRPRSIRPHLDHAAQPSSRPSSIDGRRPRGTLVHVASFRDLIAPSSSASAAAAAASGQANARVVGSTAVVLPPLTIRETAVLAAQFTLVWFVANWSLNAGLGLTSVASGTTLSSASGFFTLALGALFGVERFTFAKLGAVTISFVGVVLVTRADSVATTAAVSGSEVPSANGVLARTMATALDAPLNASLGDLLAIVSAFSYAVYVTLLKLKIGSEDRISMPLFFGLVGAINVLCLWPLGVVLHLAGWERFEWPRDGLTWAGVGVNMAITFISDFAYLLAMLKSSPLVATVGLSLTIPLALAGDVARGSHSGGWWGSVGSLMVLFSFVAIGFADLERAEPAAGTAGNLGRIPDVGDGEEDEVERGRRRE